MVRDAVHSVGHSQYVIGIQMALPKMIYRWYITVFSPATHTGLPLRLIFE